MNRNVIFALLFCTKTINSMEPKPTNPPAPPVNVTIHIHNKTFSESSAKNGVSVEQSSEENNKETNIEVNEETNIEINKKNSQMIKDFCGQTWQRASDHKYKLIGGGIVCAYAYLLYKALKGNSYLAQQNRWFSWKKELSMEELLSMPQEELAQALISQVQRRYISIANPTDFLSPLINFMRDIEAEINQLRNYHRIYTWTSTIFLSKIVPFNKKKFATVQEKIQRLLYFKNIFSSWTAKYKMARNTPEQLY